MGNEYVRKGAAAKDANVIEQHQATEANTKRVNGLSF